MTQRSEDPFEDPRKASEVRILARILARQAKWGSLRGSSQGKHSEVPCEDPPKTLTTPSRILAWILDIQSQTSEDPPKDLYHAFKNPRMDSGYTKSNQRGPLHRSARALARIPIGSVLYTSILGTIHSWGKKDDRFFGLSVENRSSWSALQRSSWSTLQQHFLRLSSKIGACSTLLSGSFSEF